MNLAITILRNALKGRSKMSSLISCSFRFSTDEDTLSVIVTGFKEGKVNTMEDTIKADKEGNELRKLFLAQAGNVKGEVKFLELNIDFLLNKSQGTVISQLEGKFITKTFTI